MNDGVTRNRPYNLQINYIFPVQARFKRLFCDDM